MLPPGTRNTLGNEGKITNISGNLANNWITIVSFNSELSRSIIKVFC